MGCGSSSSGSAGGGTISSYGTASDGAGGYGNGVGAGAGAGAGATAGEGKPKKKLMFGRDPELEKRKHEFMVQKQSNETVIRLPGSIGGQQFLVEDCTNCNIFLFDHIAALTIDQCTNCTFFIGPTASSAFFRDCKNCTVMAVLQQFRARDCKNFTTALFTQTDPVIETSKDMKFGCYNTGYTKLAEHMDGAGLSVWENKWRDVFDFNAANGVGHFKLLTTAETAAISLPIPDDVAKSVGLGAPSCIPKAMLQDGGDGVPCILVFPPGNSSHARDLVLALKPEVAVLVRSREFTLNAAQVARLFRQLLGLNKKVCPELRGPGCPNTVLGIASALIPAATYHCPAPGTSTNQVAQFFFVDTVEHKGSRLG